MKEGFRLLRTEEHPSELVAAGHHVMYDNDAIAYITNAPDKTIWNLDGTRHIPGEQVLGTQELPAETFENSSQPPITGIPASVPPAAPEIPVENSSQPAEPPVKLTIDDLYEEIEQPTEADKVIEQGGELGPDGKPVSAEDKPGEPTTGSGTGEPLTGNKRLGKFTQDEFDETKMNVRLLHHGIQNGNAWAMQLIAGEGELDEYKAYNKERFELWTELGAQLCAKYGLKPPLEVSYLTATGVNIGPAWGLAFKLNREKKKNKQLTEEKDELKLRLFLKENPEFVRRYSETGQLPPPVPENYTATAPPEKTPAVPLGESHDDDFEKEFIEAGNWVYNETTKRWHNKNDMDRSYPARDGDYIFNPEKGAMIHRTTAETKLGKPKGVKNSGPVNHPWKDPDNNNTFMPKKDITLAKQKGLTPKTIKPGWRKLRA